MRRLGCSGLGCFFCLTVLELGAGHVGGREGESLSCLLLGLLGLLALLLFENSGGGGSSFGGRQSQKKSLCWSEESYCEGCRMISL